MLGGLAQNSGRATSRARRGGDLKGDGLALVPQLDREERAALLVRSELAAGGQLADGDQLEMG